MAELWPGPTFPLVNPDTTSVWFVPLTSINHILVPVPADDAQPQYKENPNAEPL